MEDYPQKLNTRQVLLQYRIFYNNPEKIFLLLNKYFENNIGE